MALGICAVTLAGCSSSQSATAAAPIPVSSMVYQDKLRSANVAVAAAMDRLVTARSPEEASAGLKQAFGVVGEAAQLLEINPPAEVQAVHRDLLAGVRSSLLICLTSGIRQCQKRYVLDPRSWPRSVTDQGWPACAVCEKFSVRVAQV